MFADFHILGSSSSGNCALLRTENSKILIDAGFSGKRICEMLGTIDETIDTLDAVFLTHEHSDHAQGIRGLSKRQDLPVFANRDTADAVQAKLTKTVNWQVFQTGTEFSFRDLQIRSFALPHDAYDPVGYCFQWGTEGDLFQQPQSLAWVTDLGYVPSTSAATFRLWIPWYSKPTTMSSFSTQIPSAHGPPNSVFEADMATFRMMRPMNCCDS